MVCEMTLALLIPMLNALYNVVYYNYVVATYVADVSTK